jgi:hypothetical protein
LTTGKKPAAKTVKPRAKAAEKPVAKTVKSAAKKPVVKKPAATVAPKKIAVKKAPARAVPEKAAAKKTVAKMAPKKSVTKKLSPKKDEGESIENLIDKRDIDLKSVEEALGLNKYDSTKDHPLIPGKFDMIIPPGTPRKIIVNMAKEFNLEVAQRNDYYVPIGISDIQRELLVFRGDEKTILKANKEFSKRLKAWAK